jgi:hypothetical protein
MFIRYALETVVPIARFEALMMGGSCTRDREG